MMTVDQMSALCKRNEAEARAKRSNRAPDELRWERETRTSIVSSCGRYRVSDQRSGDNDEGFQAWLCATPKTAAVKLGESCYVERDAKAIAQSHSRGIPIQAELA